MAEKTVIEITGTFAPETVEYILKMFMERMETLRVTDFTVEISQTSDEELVEETEKLFPEYHPVKTAVFQEMIEEQADKFNGEEDMWTPGDEQEHLL